jgi:hypothetical protein
VAGTRADIDTATWPPARKVLTVPLNVVDWKEIRAPWAG